MRVKFKYGFLIKIYSDNNTRTRTVVVVVVVDVTRHRRVRR